MVSMQIYLEKIPDFIKKNPKLLLEHYPLLSVQKKRRVESAPNEVKKNALILSDYLAKKAISEFCGIEINEISFSHGSHGKPIFRFKNREVHFSISHSGEYVACIISNAPCGVDIEARREIKLSSAKRFCTENEMEFINSALDKPQAFLYIWTRKEAYFKSIGCGIATLLSSVDVLKTDGFCTEIKEDYILSTYEKRS